MTAAHQLEYLLYPLQGVGVHRRGMVLSASGCVLHGPPSYGQVWPMPQKHWPWGGLLRPDKLVPAGTGQRPRQGALTVTAMLLK